MIEITELFDQITQLFHLYDFPPANLPLKTPKIMNNLRRNVNVRTLQNLLSQKNCVDLNFNNLRATQIDCDNKF
jgi:hypothetical protein